MALLQLEAQPPCVGPSFSGQHLNAVLDPLFLPACSARKQRHSSSTEGKAVKTQKAIVQHSRRKARGHVTCCTRAVESIPTGRAQPHSTPEIEVLLGKLKWDASGLVVAIAQDVDTGAILMQGFSNRDAISATLHSKRATFYSRSRKQLWTKGETSSNFIDVTGVYIDCDRDSVIYIGKPDGPTCHTGADTCYFTRLESLADKDTTSQSEASPSTALTTLYSLEATIEQRLAESEADKAAGGLAQGKKPSWTRRLLEDPKLLQSKIREEADELCRSMEESEGRERTASEMADVLYHSMVLLTSQGVKFEEVLRILRTRFARSGIEEKAGRKAES